MSLMQLLATSRSINAAKDGPTRYKMAEQNLLPKFSPPRRGAPASVEASEPSAAPAKAPQRVLQPQTASPFDFHSLRSGAVQSPPPGSSSTAGTGDPSPVESARREEEPPVTVAKPISPEATNPFVAAPASKSKKSRWSLFEVLFVRRLKKNRNGHLIQGEWVLDQVTVVRNDLSDADLEVVAGKATVREVREARESKREMMTQALARFTTRFQRTEREETGGGAEAGLSGKKIKYPDLAIRS